MTAKAHHPRIALTYRDFRFFISARFLSLTAHTMFIVGLSQYVYELTRNPLHLGYIGLCIFIPKFGFTLLAGHAADQFDRRTVILCCRLAQFVIVAGLLALFWRGASEMAPIYALIFLLGTAYAFDGPASVSIVPQLVHPDHFSNAVAWNSTIMQLAFILGPAIGGFLYALGKGVLLLCWIVLALRALSILLIYLLKNRTASIEKSDLSWENLVAGLRYVFQTRLILGLISLDLFAVLLGGAVALMPIFANDILKTGPWGLGILRAAPSVGAALMALLVAHLPPFQRAGRALLVSIAVFGVATIAFGLSHSFWISVGCLFVLGAADMISMIIRGVVVQMKTPPAMRGRVSAVNLIFIGASNELGEFESGVTAAWFGVERAVLLGGVGTLLIVALWAKFFPEIRKYKRLDAGFDTPP